MRIATCSVAIILLLSVNAAFAAERSPYSGEQNRKIKALSEAEVEGLLKGQGLGYAKAAELNGYPGPKHVLELASELSLSDQQLRETEFLFQKMQAEAQKWGKRLVESEMRLDAIFARRLADDKSLESALQQIAENSAGVRATHLRAHVAQAEILSSEQIHLYAKLRGYQGMHHGHGHGDEG